MRLAAFAFLALLGCSDPTDVTVVHSSKEPRSPGAPVTSLLGSCGRLEDERVFCFHHKRGFVNELTGARTSSRNGAFGILDDESSIATCFARADGVLRCFGSALEGGLAGAPARDTCQHTPWLSFSSVPYPCARTPVVVDGAPRVTTVSSSCALSTDGNVWCWGREGRDGPLFPPTPLAGISGRARTLSAELDADRVCAILDDGHVACAHGRKPGDVARLHPDLEKIVSLSLGPGLGCFVDGAGVLRCWRDLGQDPLETAPVVATDLRFEQIAVSLFLACGVTFDRRVACFRTFGDPDPDLPPTTPTLVAGITDAAELAVELDRVYVRLRDGSVVMPLWPDPKLILVAP